MLFIVALFVIPAIAAFAFQLICFMNYKRSSSPSSSLKWGQHAAPHNI
jgi:hypothetical protein